MASNDAARHALYSQLEEILGSQNADTLMAHLPRDKSDEVATKSDIDRLGTRFDRLEQRFDRLEEKFNNRFDQIYDVIVDQQKQYARMTLWSMTALTAIFSLVVTFLA